MSNKNINCGNKHPQPAALPGFEQIRRSWDSATERYLAVIKAGEFYVTNNPQEMIKTTLGSCVSACIRDERAAIGGMNHFMLPLRDSVYQHKFSRTSLVNAARYGNWAMEYLINAILKNGGIRRHLEVKILAAAEY